MATATELTRAKLAMVEGMAAIAPHAADQQARLVLQQLNELTNAAENLITWMEEQATAPAEAPAPL